MNYIYTILGWIMNGCYALVKNYGIAILIFTVITKIVMLPLSIWTHFNSITMIKIQPDINFIKAKYYGQKDQIAEEESKLYKEKGYHPMASTIPTIIQLVLLMGVVGVIKLGIADPSIDMNWGPINLGEVPSEIGIRLLWSPIFAGLSAWLMCWTQNKSNVLQSEQSNANKYGMMIFSIALSLYLGWFVPVGTAWYWVCSNLLSIVQMYILNWCIKPSKYVDYEALEESRKALAGLENVGKVKKDKAYYANKKRERADYKRFFSVVNKHLVFYSESNGFYKYFKGYIEYILKNTNVTIHYITSDPDDKIFELEKSNDKIRAYYIGENKLITLMMKMDADVVVMTTPDLENFHIKRSYIRKDIEYIFVSHGMGSTNLTFRKGAVDHFDTIFCVGELDKVENIELENVYNLNKKNLVEVGYPLIDDMAAEYATMKNTADGNARRLIMIAPSWQKDNIIDGCLEKLLEELKKTDYDIIVRPHPQEVRLKREHIEAIKEKYDSDRITVTTDFSSHNPVMEADLLITDWSDISMEYAYTTKRPVLFVNTPMKVMNPDWKELKTVPMNIQVRDNLGKAIELSELDNLVSVVDEMLATTDSYRAKIEAFEAANLYNHGASAEAGAKYIISAIQRKIKEKKTGNV